MKGEDFVSLKLNDPTEYLDCLYTNMANSRWRWHEGGTIVTNHVNRMWSLTDDKAGVHFTGGGFCSNDGRKLFFEPTIHKRVAEIAWKALCRFAPGLMRIQVILHPYELKFIVEFFRLSFRDQAKNSGAKHQ